MGTPNGSRLQTPKVGIPPETAASAEGIQGYVPARTRRCTFNVRSASSVMLIS